MITTLVFAKCDSIERIELWDSMYALASDMSVPWLVGGDFNVKVDEEETFRGLLVSLNVVKDFRHSIDTCNLVDLGFKGSIFTWWNGRSDDACIFKRLDRCLANFELQQMMPDLEAFMTVLDKHSEEMGFCERFIGGVRTKPILCSAFMSQKYCKKLNVVIVPWNRGSHAWRKMLERTLYFNIPPDFSLDESVNNVRDVINEGMWDVNRLMTLLPEEFADHIIDNITHPVEHDVLDK
ncbi:uncharacterized protein LOC142180120 [Nicotiana tabacum]|uniref:Uncharacterized protein LOC142180120 n=1 Tax=Nicotiana tabacum TaxID=4097 RepID=A0AC58UD47_TOBAC